jgi:hypothetical protein
MDIIEGVKKQNEILNNTNIKSNNINTSLDEIKEKKLRIKEDELRIKEELKKKEQQEKELKKKEAEELKLKKQKEADELKLKKKEAEELKLKKQQEADELKVKKQQEAEELKVKKQQEEEDKIKKEELRIKEKENELIKIFNIDTSLKNDNYLNIKFDDIKDNITIDNIEEEIFDEFYNIDNLKIIFNNFDELMKTLPKHRFYKINKDDNLNSLKNKVNDLSKNNNRCPNDDNNVFRGVRYEFKHKEELKKLGLISRLYAKGASLQNMSREIRNTILPYCNKNDLDITKSYPTFLYQYGIKNNLEYPELKEYIFNHNFIKQIINESGLTKAEIKEKVLMNLMGENINIHNSR